MSEMGNSVKHPAPVLDIVSYGYRSVLRWIKPLTLISLPFLLIMGLLSGIFFEELNQYKDILRPAGQNPPSLEMLLLSVVVMMVLFLINIYMTYVYIRYVRDIFTDQAGESWVDYVFPEKLFWGFIALELLYVVVAVPLMIGVLLGSLLIVPGLLLLLIIGFFYFRLVLILPNNPITFFMEPEKGLFYSIKRSWELTRGHFWRTVLIFLVIVVVQLLMISPFYILQSGMQMVAILKPGSSTVLGYQVLYGFLVMLFGWGESVISKAGSIFVWYRYYYDLKERQTPSEPPGAAVLPQAS